MALVGKTAAPAATTPKVTAKPKAAKASSNQELYHLRGEAPGVVKRIGVVDSMNGSVLMLNFKRHGSTKYEKRPIPFKDILMIRGDAKVGGTVQVTFRSDKTVFDDIKKVEFAGHDDKLGLMKWIDSEGRPFYVRPEACSAVTMTEVAAPAVAPPKKY